MRAWITAAQATEAATPPAGTQRSGATAPFTGPPLPSITATCRKLCDIAVTILGALILRISRRVRSGTIFETHASEAGGPDATYSR